MKKFTNVKIVLFDSTAAFFKLSIEAMFTKKGNDNSISSLAYVSSYTNKYNEVISTAHLNPNIYLVITYKTDNWETTKNLYTSYPQLDSLREAIESVRNLYVSGDGYQEIEGVLTVNPLYQNNPVVITDIGQKNKWITFNLVTSLAADGVTRIPAVSIEMSDTGGYASILTIEEFLTVRTIIRDMDLTSYQIMLSNMFMQGEDDVQQSVYQQQPKQQYQQPTQGYQPQQQGYQPQQTNNYSKQKYNNTPYQRNVPRPVLTPGQEQQQNQQPQAYQPTPQIQPAQPQQQQNHSNQGGTLPARKEGQIVNLKNVEDIEVSPVKFDDEKAINDIFKDEE